MSRRRLSIVLAAVIVGIGGFTTSAPAAVASPTSPAWASLNTHPGPYRIFSDTTYFTPSSDFSAGDVVTMSVSFEKLTDVVYVESAFAAEPQQAPVSWGTAISAAAPTLSWPVSKAGQWVFGITIHSTIEGQPHGELSVTFTCQQLVLSAFEAPVDAAPVVNSAQAGRTIPFKFTATDSYGSPVTDLTLAEVTRVTHLSAGACGTTANVSVIETYSSGAGTLTHLGDGHYLYALKTDSSWRGTCGTLGVSVRGVEQTADFRFRS